MSRGCSKGYPKTDNNLGYSCNYHELFNSQHHIVNLYSVYHAGVTRHKWRPSYGLMWNGVPAGWRLCYEHWYETAVGYHFEELKKIPSWML